MNIASVGTKKSCRTIWPVIDARSDILFFSAGVSRPDPPRSKRKPRIVSVSSFAQTTNTFAIGLWLIQVLVPVRVQPPLTGFARVRIAPGSEPASGSVRPKQPMSSPEASFGR